MEKRTYILSRKDKIMKLGERLLIMFVIYPFIFLGLFCAYMGVILLFPMMLFEKAWNKIVSLAKKRR